jgi:hypothetical protein
MPPPQTLPVKNTGKGKGREEQEETARNKKRKRKQVNDDEAYKSRHDLTAESLVQEVMCNTMPIEAMLTCQLSGRRGHKLSKSTAPSLSFTAAIMNSYVCAIEAVRDSTFRTLSNPLRARTPDTGNSKLVSTSQLSKI